MSPSMGLAWNLSCAVRSRRRWEVLKKILPTSRSWKEWRRRWAWPSTLPIQLNLWEAQNIYYRMAKKIYQDYQAKAAQGDQSASQWIEQFKSLGQKLSFNLKSILPGE